MRMSAPAAPTISQSRSEGFAPITTFFLGVRPWWQRNSSAGSRISRPDSSVGRNGRQDALHTESAPQFHGRGQGAGGMDTAIIGNHQVPDGAGGREGLSGDQNRPDRAANHTGNQRIDGPVVAFGHPGIAGARHDDHVMRHGFPGDHLSGDTRLDFGRTGQSLSSADMRKFVEALLGKPGQFIHECLAFCDGRRDHGRHEAVGSAQHGDFKGFDVDYSERLDMAAVFPGQPEGKIPGARCLGPTQPWAAGLKRA